MRRHASRWRTSNRRLLAGEGKADALRHSQETLRHRPEYADPYFLGAFICPADSGQLRQLVPRS